MPLNVEVRGSTSRTNELARGPRSFSCTAPSATAGRAPAAKPGQVATPVGSPGQTRTVTFTLNKSDFGFYDNRGRFVVEPGQIDVYAGNSSAADTKQSFTVRR